VAAFFCYKTLRTDFQSPTKTMEVRFKSPLLTLRTLKDLEDLFTWATHHIEIRSIVLGSDHEVFCHGHDPVEWESYSSKEVEDFLKRFQRLIYIGPFMPQTLICDLGEGAKGLGLELALSCDMRISHHKAQFHFDHLEAGMVPTGGGIGLLSHLVSPSLAKSWVLSSHQADSEEFLRAGLLFKTYEEPGEHLPSLLNKVFNQSSVQRIQAKRAYWEHLKEYLQHSLASDFHISSAGLQTGDWKESLLAKKEGRSPNFTCARELKTLLSLDKSEMFN
jgi:methylglutaconyl-CoA hydratase